MSPAVSPETQWRVFPKLCRQPAAPYVISHSYTVWAFVCWSVSVHVYLRVRKSVALFSMFGLKMGLKKTLDTKGETICFQQTFNAKIKVGETMSLKFYF